MFNEPIPPIVDDDAISDAPLPLEMSTPVVVEVVSVDEPVTISPTTKIPVSVVSLIQTSRFLSFSTRTTFAVALEVVPVIVSPPTNPVVSVT